MSVLEVDARENKLLKRMEIRAKLGYVGKPLTRKDVVTLLASHLKIPVDGIVAVKVETITGMNAMRVHAHAYHDINHAKRFERPYILKRCGLTS